jgi:tight adherence protein B
MIGFIAITFLVVLGALMLSISTGLRFFESTRRKQLVSVLRTVTETEEPQVDLLMNPDDRKRGEAMPIAKAIHAKLNLILTESGTNWTMSRLLVFTGAGFGIGLILGGLIPFQAPLLLKSGLAACLLAWLPLFYVKRARGKRLDAMEAQLPDSLDFLARSMRAGHAFTISIEMVGEEIADPLGQEFRALFNEQNLGASLDRSLANFGKRVPLADVRFFSSAVLLQRQTGGNLGEVLGRLSHIIRERFRLKGQVKATSAHGRLTATILTVLPLATLAGLIITSPGYLSPLLTEPLGRKLVVAGVICQILGNIVIRRIIRIRV